MSKWTRVGIITTAVVAETALFLYILYVWLSGVTVSGL
jgi:hypothetical protein